MPVGKRIYSNFTRPNRELVEQFRGLPTANIADCMGRISCIDTEIYPLNHTPLLGTALTVKVPGGDNLMFHKALEMAQEGDILVINGFGDMTRSLCGELMATTACQIMRCDSDSGKKLIKSMVLRTADRQGMC